MIRKQVSSNVSTNLEVHIHNSISGGLLAFERSPRLPSHKTHLPPRALAGGVAGRNRLSGIVNVVRKISNLKEKSLANGEEGV